MKESLLHLGQLEESASLGGKAKNLRRLSELGFQVPKWTLIPHEALDSLLSSGTKRDTLHIKKEIESLSIPKLWIEEIKASLGIKDGQKTFLAVRSSAVDEDGSDFSFAGLFESYLFIPPTELEPYIKKVWLSAYSERVRAYRENHDLLPQTSMSIIIQLMVHADVAGVAFGMNPQNGRHSEKVISSVFGLGEGLVSGDLNADTFMYHKDGIEEKIASKSYAYLPIENGTGLKKVSLAKERQNQPSLNPQQILEITEVLDRLEEAFEKPQDIEFAYADGHLFLLQSRAITSLGKVPEKEREKIVWDNSNIIESYPGVTTPLTFSFIIKMYEAVYSQLVLILGIREKELKAHRWTLQNMLGLLNGRVYYNLKSWYQLLALLPAYSLNAGFMEKMMGVKESFELDPEDLPQYSKWEAWKRIFIMGRKMVAHFRGLPKERKRFKDFLDEVIADYQAIDFDSCRAEELMHLYLKFELILVEEWKAPLINDLFAMIFFGSLEKLITKWEIGNNPNLHNDLHCGSQDIISTEPIHRLFSLSHKIGEQEEAKSLFLSKSPPEIWKSLKGGDFPEIYAEIEAYLRDFGERCVGELKLETLSYKQAPEILLGILKSYVEQGINRHLTRDNMEERLRKEAEKEAAQSLKGKFFKKRIFNYVLSKSRELVSSRENLRYERTRGFGIVREIFSAIGNRFYEQGFIDHHRDIFYLSKEEIFAFISGTAISTQIKESIDLRKKEYKEYNDMEAPAERITSYGVVYHGNDFYPLEAKVGEGNSLRGVGSSPGKVKARVRVIKDPRETHTLGGDILVTSSTDPGWVTLFPSASAILVERGSLLSHSAIVSREMGIPCIVGIEGLLKRLNTGDWVEMDGSSGIINIIDHE